MADTSPSNNIAGGVGTAGSTRGDGMGEDGTVLVDSKFVQIYNLVDAGIAVDQGPRWFYRRPAFDELSEFVSKMVQGGHLGLIDGLPGTGKSSTLWWKLQQLEKKVLWIHLGRDGEVLNVVKVNCAESKVEYAKKKPESTADVLAKLELIPYYNELDILVIDGVNQGNFSRSMVALRRFAMDKLSERCGFLTMSNKIKKEHKHQLDILKVQQERGNNVAQLYHTQHSWTLEEYMDAFVKTDGSATELFAQVQPGFQEWGDIDVKGEFLETSKRLHDGSSKHISVEDAATQKYAYAGGSARWMMSETKDSIDAMISDYARECVSLNALVDFTLGEGSPFAKTHLYASSLGNKGLPVYSLVSQHATILALNILGAAGTKTLYQHAIKLKNPAFLGWVVEADLMQRCASGALVLEAADGSFVEFSDKGEEPTEFDHAASVAGASVASMTPLEGETRVCKPSGWNQGGYDVIFVRAESDKKLALRFGQVTKSTSHSLKLRYFAEVVVFLSAAGYHIVSVEIAFIAAKQDVRKFRVSPSKVVGRGLLSRADHPRGGKWKQGKEEDLVTVYGIDLTKMGYNL